VKYIQAQDLGARLVYTLLFRPSILPFGTSGTFGLPGMHRVIFENALVRHA
jgi:hypothetical protein